MTNDKIIHAAPQKSKSVKLVRKLYRTYLWPYISSLLFAVILMAIAAAMTAAIAQLMEPILDDVLGGQKTDMILPVAFMVMGVFVVRGFTTYGHTIIMNRIGQSIVADIQKDLFSHFMTLDLGFFHANPSGQLISRVVNDVNVVRIAVADSLTGFGKSVFTLLFLTFVMFYQDWKLSLAAFTIFPVAALFVARIGRRLRKVSHSIQGEMGNLSDRLSQIFQGIRQVQAYGMEGREIERSGEAIGRVRDLNIKSVRIANLSTPFSEVLVGFVFFGIIIYGGWAASRGEITAGQLASFLAAFTLAYEPMKKLAKLNNSLQMGLGAAERVFAMMDQKPLIEDAPGAMALQTRQPEIAFDNVHFEYQKNGVRDLNNISFSVSSGKVLALVGPSGAGKTTVINLIPRFYDVLGGRILIDGQDIREFTLESLRAHIALVSQDVTIFDDTIAANIAYGAPGASEDSVIEAAKAAAAHDFISAFEDGYQTKVGEDGVRLSGGQRQRIAIARAILRDAPILLLDEATSALDNESEKLVQAALERLEKGRTTIVIAHRLSTVQNADEILVMDKGEIVERGTHSVLMERDGLYAKIYRAGSF
ncbi:MAG: lipid A export permease/ATP-binding protein MsbA [Alphaproteobacteria bacterium]|nr:lipid A export permease/ATP-binding protein MsbA [Alphaproteobacteria bacterium]